MLSVALPQPQWSSLHFGFYSKMLSFSAFVEKSLFVWDLLSVLMFINPFLFFSICRICIKSILFTWLTVFLFCCWFFSWFVFFYFVSDIFHFPCITLYHYFFSTQILLMYFRSYWYYPPLSLSLSALSLCSIFHLISLHACVCVFSHPPTGILIPAFLSSSPNPSLSSPTPFPLPVAPPTALTKGRETQDTKLRGGSLIIFSKTSPSHFLAQQPPRVSCKSLLARAVTRHNRVITETSNAPNQRRVFIAGND